MGNRYVGCGSQAPGAAAVSSCCGARRSRQSAVRKAGADCGAGRGDGGSCGGRLEGLPDGYGGGIGPRTLARRQRWATRRVWGRNGGRFVAGGGRRRGGGRRLRAGARSARWHIPDLSPTGAATGGRGGGRRLRVGARSARWHIPLTSFLRGRLRAGEAAAVGVFGGRIRVVMLIAPFARYCQLARIYGTG